MHDILLSLVCLPGIQFDGSITMITPLLLMMLRCCPRPPSDTYVESGELMSLHCSMWQSGAMAVRCHSSQFTIVQLQCLMS